MQEVFIIGSKGIPGAYGGYETFVDRLTQYHENNKNIHYHVACKNPEKPNFVYNGADCFGIQVPDHGKSQAVVYDIKALKYCCKYIKEHDIKNAIVYILACRIGPWTAHYHRVLKRLGAKLYINPDGHEWKRKKWNPAIRKYWKFSEHLMVKHSDLSVCDNRYMETYIAEEYKKYKPATTFIAYGATVAGEIPVAAVWAYDRWMASRNLRPGEYYLIVGRFVPENNYETVIREYMKSHTDKKLAIITTANDAFLAELEAKLHFEKDERIQFVGTVYDKELLTAIRVGAYGYIHGHEVGGTNPSLLEALGATRLNLVCDVNFNRDVCRDCACYWTKDEGVLAKLIDEADAYTTDKLEELGKLSKERINTEYSWEHIASEYEKLFLKA